MFSIYLIPLKPNFSSYYLSRGSTNPKLNAYEGISARRLVASICALPNPIPFNYVCNVVDYVSSAFVAIWTIYLLRILYIYFAAYPSPKMYQSLVSNPVNACFFTHPLSALIN